MIALLDADLIVYKAGCSSEKVRYQFVHNNKSVRTFDDLTLIQIRKELKSDGLTMKDGVLQKMRYAEPLAHALHKTKLIADSLLETVNATDYRAYLTSADKSNYRYSIAKTKPYKGNRKASSKPIHYDAIRDFVMNTYKAEIVYGQEADDALAIQQMKHLTKSIIVSIDKDLDMVPGYHYNYMYDQQYIATDPGTLEISKDHRKLRGTGIKWFYAQMLLGDSADNIPGISGLGPVAAYNYLKGLTTEKEMVYCIRDIYAEHKVLDRFKEVLDLLWMRRNEGEFKSNLLEKEYGI